MIYFSSLVKTQTRFPYCYNTLVKRNELHNEQLRKFTSTWSYMPKWENIGPTVMKGRKDRGPIILPCETEIEEREVNLCLAGLNRVRNITHSSVL